MTLEDYALRPEEVCGYASAVDRQWRNELQFGESVLKPFANLVKH